VRYAVLHGRRSGHRSDAGLVAHVGNVLVAGGHQVELLTAEDVAAAHSACATAVVDGVDVLLVIGGDGAVRIAASHCVGSETAIAIVPAGSGNDTVRSLAIPTGTADAIQVARRGHRWRIDVIHASSTAANDMSSTSDTSTTSTTSSIKAWQDYVVGSVPAALDARIAARSQRVPSLLGPAKYAAAALVEIPQLRPQPYRLHLDGPGSQGANGTQREARDLEVEALVVAVCNLPIFGGGMQIAPDANPSDGLLDVVMIEKVGPGAALGLLRGVFTGTHADHPAVRIERCSRIDIAGPELTAYGDGDPLGPLPLTCEVRPGALDVIVPAGNGKGPDVA